MTIHHQTADDYLFATSLEQLRSLGISLRTGSDFEEYRAILAEARPDHDLGVPFEPTRHALTEANAYWMVGYDEHGDIMHTQALKKLSLGQLHLGDYLNKNLRSFEPSQMEIDYSRTIYRPGPGAQRMKGEIAYHGEFWVGGTPGQFRGTGLSTLLGRHAFLTAMIRWQPDFFFGFMSKPLVFKGFAARFGYMHIDPGAIRYVLKDTGEGFEGIMGYMSHDDIRYMLDMASFNQVPRAA